ncbi:MAG: ACP S-malonyltransferase [Ruminococcus sp.]|nr:ACP S-malonyltransferase [Ruminococcus sp.]
MSNFKRAFLFNGIGTKPEKLLRAMTPAMVEKYRSYQHDGFVRLGLSENISENASMDKIAAEWLSSLISDRVIFEYYIEKGIIPDIGMGHSSGIVSVSACFGSVSHEFAHEIIMMNRATMRSLEKSGEKQDMGTIIGLSIDDVNELIAENNFSTDDVIVGSANSRICTMISGKEETVEQLLLAAQEAGAIKVIPFRIGLAYHHPMIRKHSDEYVQFCGGGEYHDPKYPVLSIFDQRIMTTGADLMLENQINILNPIRWDIALKHLEEMGVTEFFDVSANGAVGKFSRINKRKGRIYTFDEV